MTTEVKWGESGQRLLIPYSFTLLWESVCVEGVELGRSLLFVYLPAPTVAVAVDDLPIRDVVSLFTTGQKPRCIDQRRST